MEGNPPKIEQEIQQKLPIKQLNWINFANN